MEFRWIALLALWTLISGPILGVSSTPSGPRKVSAPAVKAKAVLPRR
ncbi:MAG: hypothetical protein ACRC33_17355 [Gemmataceae bacterium]